MASESRLTLPLPFRSTDRPATPAPKAVDPFGLWPGRASRIDGLGGPEPASGSRSRAAYAFHTDHLLARAGRARFTGRFDGLSVAADGMLTLRVRAMPLSRTRAFTVAERRVPLGQLAAAGGGWEIDFPARETQVYAVSGRVSADARAAAAGLEVAIHGWSDGDWHRRRMAAAAPGLCGPMPTGWLAALAARRAARRGLLLDGPATLAEPVSQMCTAAQLAEPVALDWIRRIGWHSVRHRKQWETLYILQVLARFGLIGPGSHGLGFGCGREFLPSFLAAEGCRVTATDQPEPAAAAAGWIDTGQHSHTLQGLHWPALCSADLFRERVRFRTADMNAIPPELRGFDFCWSACALEHLGSIHAGLRFIERSLHCLCPGGVAVHTTEFNLLSNSRTLRRGGTVLFRRRDLEGLAVRLADRGHRVMPLRFHPGDQPLDAHVDVPPFADDPHLRLALRHYATTSFGFVVQRGTDG